MIKYSTYLQNNKSKNKNLALFKLTNQNSSRQSKTLRRGMSCELYLNNINSKLISKTKLDEEFSNQKSMDNIFFKLIENKINVSKENLYIKTFSPKNINKKSPMPLQKKKMLETSNKKENKMNQIINKGKSTLIKETNKNNIKRTNSHNISYNTKIMFINKN